MRVLFFSDQGPSFFPFIRNEIEGLIKGNDLMYICAVDTGKQVIDGLDLRLIPHNIYDLKSKIGWRLEKLNLSLNLHKKKFSRQLTETIEKFDPDIIHCQFGYEALKLIDNFDNHRNLPIVITFRGYDASVKLRSSIYRKRLRELLTRSDVMAIFVCHALRENMIGLGVNPSQSEILYSGTKASFFKRSKSYPGSPPFVFTQVASFSEKKGHNITLRAFAKMIGKMPFLDARLILAGEGKMLEATKSLSRQLGITEKVEFPGRLSPEEVRDLLEKTHVFVHHSLTTRKGDMEGIPNSLMEAMSMELPVVTTHHSGIPELVADPENGFLVEEGDIDNFSLKMYEALNLGLLPRNRDKVKSQFEFDDHSVKLLNIYHKLVPESV